MASTLQAFFINFAFLGLQAVTSLISAVAMAGYQIANNILKLTYCITHGIEAAQITLVGNALSESNKEKARLYSYKLLNTSETVCFIWAVIMFIFARFFASLFVGSSDTATLDAATNLLRILCFTVPFTTYYQSSQGTLKVGGETAALVLSSILGPWAIRIPLAYILITSIESGTLWGALEGFFSEVPFICPISEAILTNGITGLITGLFADYIMRTIVHAYKLHKEKWL
ncbi:MAG: MATE family efflux transporter, partial [Clostridia bacterium]|nr:MATE family efflux transporter [Clostridia bacterium]